MNQPRQSPREPDLFGGEPSPDASDPAGTLEGVLDRIVFANPENGYTVAAFRVAGQAEPVTVVGNLFGANVGESLRVAGEWTANPRFGRQFKLRSFIPIAPSSMEAMERYLASGLIHGVGEVYAKRIVERFGARTFQMLDDEPARLRDVPGIGRKRAEQIRAAWGRQRAIREVVVFLQQHGVSPAWAIRLFKIYGEQAPAVLRTDPFRLALEVHGIGFASADKIARSVGIAADDPKRAQAGVRNRLVEHADNGHTYAPMDSLVSETAEMLGVGEEVASQAIAEMTMAGLVVCDSLPDGQVAVYDKPLHAAETGVAQALQRLTAAPKKLPSLDPGAEIAAFEQKFHFAFAAKQREAVSTALSRGLLVLTGGPGTGKTTTLRGIIQILSNHAVPLALAAPTGRAAKRLSETTKTAASTIHRLLKWNPQKGGFAHNESNPLQIRFLIVDETSMLDIALAYHLLRAIPPSCGILFVGDTDQLPSVGPGNFLADLIGSKTLPVVRLDEIFRQARSSLIVVNAHRINQGQLPFLKPPGEIANPDFFFISKEEPPDILAAVKELVRERIPRKFGLDPRDEVQVITPMRRGDLGVASMNDALQELLNPETRVIVRGRSAFRLGDKVMQIRNNYDREVFNGDIGRIVEIREADQTVFVLFDGRKVLYEFDDLDELVLAYAITVHKSQGSEYPAVIIPIHTQHFVLLQRNLFYTALTRGKKLVCVVGSRKALGIAVNNARVARRFSGLAARLRQAQKGL